MSAEAPLRLEQRNYGLCAYADTLSAMQQFTANRSKTSADQLWGLEHWPVYTLGMRRDRSHLKQLSADIPVVESDRGGEVTYHGPGQAVVYVLWDLGRLRLSARALVVLMEQAVVRRLQFWGIESHTRSGAPGVYVGDKKIASLGLRISRSCSYHGLALNVDNKLAPFDDINPCGYRGLSMSSLLQLGCSSSAATEAEALVQQLAASWQSLRDQLPQNSAE